VADSSGAARARWRAPGRAPAGAPEGAPEGERGGESERARRRERRGAAATTVGVALGAGIDSRGVQGFAFLVCLEVASFDTNGGRKRITLQEIA
jgi:hypothetical protein